MLVQNRVKIYRTVSGGKDRRLTFFPGLSSGRVLVPDNGGCQLPEERSKEECAKNLGGGTGAATIGNWERFLVFLEFYFQLLLCDCDAG